MDASENQMKQRIYTSLLDEIVKRPWSKDEAKLARFMQEARNTLNGAGTVELTESWQAAWKEAGMKGKITYRAIRKLGGTI